LDFAKQAVALVIYPSSKKQCVGVAAVSSVSDSERPQTRVGDWIPRGVEQHSKKGTCQRIEDLDGTVTIVADQ
jgi:hypothetical protein